ncbi:MFS transporter [Pseudomonas sp. CCI1.2]|uniref:MFS transporter n=1 Tax=Pseudomonas sp. CCI1.2 TaxID=3048614 RepID=UPI002B23CDC0|nr:MFS transporter [Pseudomonas sp. CCI1.2]MEB0119730.1 MFS transporter [Pseudomonas sp. CCI1.2]
MSVFSASPLQQPAMSAQAMLAARMDRLPSSKVIWQMVILLSLGGFFETYELFSTSFVIPGIIHSGVLTASTAGLFDIHGAASYIAATFIGMFIGTSCVSFVADRLGRRRVFIYALLGYCACSLIMACQTDAMGLCFWRLMAGIGLGVELVTIDTYLGELVPPGIRGRAFAYNHVISYLAGPICGVCALLLVPHEPYGIEGWRWVIGLGTLGSLGVFLLRGRLPESPRWLASRGHIDRAEQIVAELERKSVLQTGRDLLSPTVTSLPPQEHKGHFSELWNRKYARRTFMLVIFHFFASIGVYGFMNWVPTFLIEQGVSVAHSLAYTIAMGCSAPLGPLLNSTFADKVERKWQIAGAALVMAIGGLAFAFVREPSLVILCGVLVTVGSTVMSVSYHAYQSELYPTRIRSQAVGFVYSFSRISGMLSGFMIAFLLGHYGVISALGLVAGSMVVVALIIGTMGPRARGRTLEAIND